MAAPFVPLAPGCAPGTSSPSSVRSQPTLAASAKRAFQPLPECAKAVPAALTSNPVASREADGASPSAPAVTCKRGSDGQITHIRIQCRCGEVIELECGY